MITIPTFQSISVKYTVKSDGSAHLIVYGPDRTTIVPRDYSMNPDEQAIDLATKHAEEFDWSTPEPIGITYGQTTHPHYIVLFQ